MVAAALLIILNFICFGALFILFFRIREISHAQGMLADRIGVIEEMMLELTHDDITLTEEPPLINGEPVNMEELREEQKVFPVEEERTRKILEMSRRGIPAEVIAQQAGYSIGEVRLILNLYQRHSN